MYSKSYNIEYSYKFAKDIFGADKELLLQGVKNDPWWLERYRVNILKITKEKYDKI